MYMLMKVVPRNLFVLCEDGKVFLFLEGGIKMKRIGFIGAGSMAEAMIKGLVKSGAMEPEAIFVTNQSNTARLRELSETYGVCGEADTAKVAARSDTLVLAMKPKDAAGGIAALRPICEKNSC